MTKKSAKRQAMVHKPLHRKLQIEQHLSTCLSRTNSIDVQVHAPPVPVPVLLLLLKI